MPPIYIGDRAVTKRYVGSTEVTKVYLGVQEIFSAGIAPSRYMFASHTIAPNTRFNTGDPATTPAERYQVSQVTFDRPLWSATNLRFAWQNGTTVTGTDPAERNAPTSITFSAKVFDFLNNYICDIKFGGASSVTLDPGGLVWCDPIPLASIAAAEQPVIRTFSTLPDGGQRPVRRSRDQNRTRVTSTATESTALGYMANGVVVPSNTASPNNYAFAPVAQIADNWDGRSVVLIVGDSIAAGNDNTEGRSWITDALYSAVNGRMSYLNMAIHGTKPSNQDSASEYALKAAIVDTVVAINGGVLPMTHTVSEMGVNDSWTGGTAAELQAKVQGWLNYIGGKWAAPIIQTTYTPRNTNDAANIQTSEAGMIAGTQSPANGDRWGVADWIKTNPAPLAGHIDVREAWTGSATGTTWRIIPWSATLTAPASIGATSIEVDVAPPVGIVPVLTPGSSSTVECTGIPIGIVTGTGPYTLPLNKALTRAHSIGATVKATMSQDGLHPEEGYASQLAQAVVEAVKPTLLS